MSQIVSSDPQPVEATLEEPSGLKLPESHCPSNSTWHDSIRSAIRTSAELLTELNLSHEQSCSESERDFPVFVPREFMRRMKPGDSQDPLLRQVLADSREQVSVNGFTADPVGDLASESQPGLLRKYKGRALMVLTGACAVHCRYCFRRQFPYDLLPKSPSVWQPLLDEIRADQSLEEVILSGGDPLMQTDSSLAWLSTELSQIEHVRRLRIHTRMPVIVPTRICASLLEWLEIVRPALFLVLHVNHPNELDASVTPAVEKLKRAGATLLNQAVLLRGVNDQPAVQLELCKKLLDLQIIPYYLHQLDRVIGTAHYEVPVDEGLRIISFLRDNLPGYGVPKYVREVAGEGHKRPL